VLREELNPQAKAFPGNRLQEIGCIHSWG
jgi:hypothetical protein